MERLNSKVMLLTEIKEEDYVEGGKKEHRRPVSQASTPSSSSDSSVTDRLKNPYSAPPKREHGPEYEVGSLSPTRNLYMSPLAHADKPYEWSPPDVDDQEYDTDLEDDFTPDYYQKQSRCDPENDKPIDPTGEWVYREECARTGQVPVSYICRNLGEGFVRMRHHYLGEEGTKPLAAAIKENTIIDTLDISDNYLDQAGGVYMAKVLHENTFITNLDLSMNFLKAAGCSAICEMLETNTSLSCLSLSGNRLIDSDALKVSEALKSNVSLSFLDLSHNGFTDVGGCYLADGLAVNVGLLDMDLSWNGIREKGAMAVGKALQRNNTLEILDISWNGLALAGAGPFATALQKNTKLKVLDMSNNRFNEEAALKLAAGLKRNKGLETLLMGINPIGEKGLNAILQAVQANQAVNLLGLESISMNQENHLVVLELERSRDMIIICDAPGNALSSQMQNRVLEVFDRYIGENVQALEDLFYSLDKDHSGDVTMEELKHGLKGAGLRLTNKLLTHLLEEIDEDKSGTIEYHELMEGRLQRQRALKAIHEEHKIAENQITTKSKAPSTRSTSAVTASEDSRDIGSSQSRRVESGQSRGVFREDTFVKSASSKGRDAGSGKSAKSAKSRDIKSSVS